MRSLSPVLLFLLALTPAVPAKEIHSELCPGTCPQGAPDTNDLIIRSIYLLSSNDETKFADWVSYRVTPETIGASGRRNFRPDPLLDPGETLERGDYDGANSALNTDRGHQVPLASFSGTPFADQTNFLSNITPQKSNLNQGPWRELEDRVRDVAREIGMVHVMTGPVYEREIPPLPGADEPHRVPSGYWKIVAVETDGGIRATAFFFDQETPRSGDICDHREAVDQVESRTGLDFFADLGTEEESVLEAGAGSEVVALLGCEEATAGPTTAKP